MHITHITEYDPFDPDICSGTAYWIAKSMEKENPQFKNLYIATSQKMLPPIEEMLFRCKQLWAKYYKRATLDSQLFSPRAHHVAAISNQYLQHQKTDVILTSLSPLSAAYLETKLPIVYWTDSIYTAMAGYLPSFRFHHPDTMWDGHEVTNACLMNASLLIFSTQWAARSAIELHGISKDKVKVVPFGANLEITHTLADVKHMIKARAKNCIKLLFVAKNWYSKGGDIALEIAKTLDSAGYPVELTIVGVSPPDARLPSFVKQIDFISKYSKAGLNKLFRLYQESHFLLVPSRAEAFGIVFCEANAFGVPCITTHTGGISDVVRDGMNGMTFSLETTIQQYCDYISNLMDNDTLYESLALSAFNEYQTRLNWECASSQVKKYIEGLI